MKTSVLSTITLTATLTFAAAQAFAPAAAHAQSAPGKGTFSTAFASRYVWRGQILSKGMVAQPTVGIVLGGFGANLWTNVDLDNAEEDDDGVVMNETDLTLNYAVPVGPATLTGGLIHYDFDGGDTQELYLSCALATLLNPSLTLYYDVDEGEGGFAVLAVSQPIAAGPISLTAGASLGINLEDKAMGVNSDNQEFTGLYYGEVSLATSIPIFGNVSIDPRIAYSTALGDHGEHAIKSISVDGEKSILYGSIALTAAF